MEEEEGEASDFSSISDDLKLQEVQEGEYGCKHYSRAVLKQCSHPACEGRFYKCRLCHDEEWDQVTDIKKHH
jgi:RING finger and CHY zinc finger domain-containing protein 1